MRPAEETPPPARKTVQDGDQDHPIRALNAPQDRPQDGFDRLTVAQAAERLQVTQDAVRKRIARGTIVHDNDNDGRIFVYLDTFERASKTVQDAGQDKYTRSLEDQIEFMRRELERKDAIILSLTQRIPELEASSEPRDDSEAASPRSDRGGTMPEGPPEPTQRRSWLYRFLMGP